mgnify:CR=1 FL=1
MTIKLTLEKRYAGKKAGETIEVGSDAEALALTNLGLASAATKTAEKAIEKAAKE